LEVDPFTKRFCKVIEVVRAITSYKGGVRPAFHPGHVIKTLFYLMDNGPAGRKVLSKELNLGETSVRSLFKRLKHNGFIEIDRVAGAYLTNRGRELSKALSEMIVLYKDVKIFNWNNPVLIIISMMPPRNTPVLIIRDKAISINADAALIAFIENNELRIPGLPVSSTEHHIIEEVIKKIKDKKCINNCTIIYASLRNTPLEIEGLYLGYSIAKFYCQRIKYC